MEKGNLRNVLISGSTSNFSLAGKINPTFQNEGTAVVYIDGRRLDPGQSYAVNVPNVVLQNTVPITFENDSSKTHILYLGFVELI